MSIQATQQYIVHLDIRATAPDPAQAVQDALEQVMLGGGGDVAYTVEAVATSDARLAAARPIDAPRVLGGVRSRGVYGGEFLG